MQPWLIPSVVQASMPIENNKISGLPSSVYCRRVNGGVNVMFTYYINLISKQQRGNIYFHDVGPWNTEQHVHKYKGISKGSQIASPRMQPHPGVRKRRLYKKQWHGRARGYCARFTGQAIQLETEKSQQSYKSKQINVFYEDKNKMNKRTN